MKAAGLTGSAVAINFSRRLLQPIQNRVHPTYEYWGQADLTRTQWRKVSKLEMAARVKELEDWERDVMYELAHARIELDLDDGVKVNYNKFPHALAKVTGLSDWK